MLTLTQEHINRAFRIASWYGRRARRAEISDLESAALEGLAKAARDWDAGRTDRNMSSGDRRRSFWSFAFTRILGEMRDELRRFDYLTRTQRARVVEDATGTISLDDEKLKWIVPVEPLSLEHNATEIDATGERPSIRDSIAESRNAIEDSELRDALRRGIRRLPHRVAMVLIMLEVQGYSNAEVAETFGVTPGRVSQLRHAGLESLRDSIGESVQDVA